MAEASYLFGFTLGRAKSLSQELADSLVLYVAHSFPQALLSFWGGQVLGRERGKWMWDWGTSQAPRATLPTCWMQEKAPASLHTSFHSWEVAGNILRHVSSQPAAPSFSTNLFSLREPYHRKLLPGEACAQGYCFVVGFEKS